MNNIHGLDVFMNVKYKNLKIWKVATLRIVKYLHNLKSQTINLTYKRKEKKRKKN